MADWNDVRRIALALPQTSERSKRGLSWCVRGKFFAWERPLRPADLRALGKRAPQGPVLGLHVQQLDAKEALLAARPDVVFTPPHFDGYAAILVGLDAIDPTDLEELIVEAWLARAPKRLAQQYLEPSERRR